MKFRYQFAVAVLALGIMNLAPAVAHASTPGVAHTHEQVFHDRTPRVHDHSSHAHHS